MLAQLQSLAHSATPTELAAHPAITDARMGVLVGPPADAAIPGDSPAPSTRSPGRPQWHLARWALAAAVASAATVVWVRQLPDRVTVPPPPTVAVLVFQHGNNAELEPLAIGLTLSLIAALGAVPRLEVRSLEAVLPYRNGLSQVSTIGRNLRVRWLVGGTVIRFAQRVVVSAELTDAATGRLIARREASASPGQEVGLIDQLVSTVATMLRERVGDQIRLDGWRAGTRVDEALDAVIERTKVLWMPTFWQKPAICLAPG